MPSLDPVISLLLLAVSTTLCHHGEAVNSDGNSGVVLRVTCSAREFQGSGWELSCINVDSPSGNLLAKQCSHEPPFFSLTATHAQLLDKAVKVTSNPRSSFVHFSLFLPKAAPKEESGLNFTCEYLFKEEKERRPALVFRVFDNRTTDASQSYAKALHGEEKNVTLISTLVAAFAFVFGVILAIGTVKCFPLVMRRYRQHEAVGLPELSHNRRQSGNRTEEEQNLA